MTLIISKELLARLSRNKFNSNKVNLLGTLLVLIISLINPISTSTRTIQLLIYGIRILLYCLWVFLTKFSKEIPKSLLSIFSLPPRLNQNKRAKLTTVEAGLKTKNLRKRKVRFKIWLIKRINRKYNRKRVTKIVKINRKKKTIIMRGLDLFKMEKEKTMASGGVCSCCVCTLIIN